VLILATILDNPGEPIAETRYRDPAELSRLGYNGLVLFETTALSGIDRPDSVGTDEVRRWVAQHFETVGRRIDEARAADLNVYLAYDVLCLPAELVEEHIDVLTCRNRPATLCPASDDVLARSVKALESLLGQLPDVDGIVLRIGDNDTTRLPHLVGNDIYQPHCPRCSLLGRADRIVRIVEPFHRSVVERLGKRLIVRAWNVNPGGMHDSAELFGRVHPRLPGGADDDRLVLSFKFTQADF